MGEFSPIYGKHAINEAAIFIEFANQFTKEDLNNLQDLKRILGKDFPQHEDILAFEFKKENSGLVPLQQNAGFTLKKISYVGDQEKLDWLLRITDKTISVHCLEYVRWEGFIQTSLQYFIQAFKKLNLSQNKLHTIVLKYIDKFKYEGDADSYKKTRLFKKENIFIAPKVLNCEDTRWHNHTGWFEEYDENTHILNQINIDASYIGQPFTTPHFTTIDHNAILRSKDNSTPLTIEMPVNSEGEAYSALQNALNKLHSVNKDVIRNMLTSDMLDRIHFNSK